MYSMAGLWVEGNMNKSGNIISYAEIIYRESLI